MAVKILLHALVLLGALPLVLVLAEVIKITIALSYGWKIVEFKPWPHKRDGQPVVASIIFDPPIRTGNKIWFYLIAPMMFSFCMGLLFWVLGYVVSSYLYSVAIAFSLDWLLFLKDYAMRTPGSDGEQLRTSIQ